MKRLLVVLLLAGAPLAGQIGGLATTDDGSVLYFSSVLRLRGTEQFPHEKIFRWEGGEFEVFAQVERVFTTGGPNNFFRLITPSLSGDGDVVSYVGLRDCIGGSRCVEIEYFESIVTLPGADEPLILDGRVQLSGNGRFAVQFRAPAHLREVRRVDLVTGEQIAIPPGLLTTAGRQAITSEGLIAVGGIGGLSLWSPEENIPIPIQGDHLGSAIINDQGTHVIYESFLPTELHAIELGSGTDTLLSDADVDFFGASVSKDGSLVLYLVPGEGEMKGTDPGPIQVFLTNSDGTGGRQLTDVPEGVSHAVLSGDGSMAYAVTFWSRLLRIDVATGGIEELVPRTPFISDIHGGAAPGSLSFIDGTGLSEAVAVADAPLPEVLEGVAVRLGDEVTRVLLVAPHDVRFQIPFELEPGDYVASVPGPDSPFEQTPYVLMVSEQNPRFVRNGVEVVAPGLADSRAITVNLDFSALITDDNPARPSDIVSFYMTGLGTTEPVASTGEPTPIGPLLLPDVSIECSWLTNDGRRPIETFFAGLAPGLIGVYQVTTRLPPDPPPFEVETSRSAVSIDCGLPDGPMDFATVPIRLDN